MPRRSLPNGDAPYDIAIIGAGITGAGAARDAARRGLRVLLLDLDDVASGTSSRSSKLVHGGLRYLEKGEFSLVFEAVAERRLLQDIAPHLVNPLPFLFPVYRESRRGVFTVNVGMWLYDGLSLFRSPKMHRNLSVSAVHEAEPGLRREGLKGAPLYYDCATDDARLTLETVLDAAKAGADVATHVQVTGLTLEGGRVRGLRFEDRLSGEAGLVEAAVVINATGPWSDRTRALGTDTAADRLRPTKGVHIVVNADRLAVHHAVVGFHPEDGRVFFVIPWGDQTYIGTTDTDFEGDPGQVAADGEDVRYLLAGTQRYFPDVKLQPSDVVSTWAGVRPLIAAPEEGAESSVSREHDIRVGPDGLITIAGGKLTTYRLMGAEVVDKAVDLLRMLGKCPPSLIPFQTGHEPLPGAIGWPENDDHAAVAAQVEAAGEGRIGAQTARLLADTYGMRSVDIAEMAAADADLARPLVEGRPEIVAQVRFAVDHELASTLSDVFIRRTQLYYRDSDQGLGAVDAVAAMMADALGWDDALTERMVDEYRQVVARSRAWRDD